MASPNIITWLKVEIHSFASYIVMVINIQQIGCKPFNQKGNVTYENRYNIKNWSDRPEPQNALDKCYIW